MTETAPSRELTPAVPIRRLAAALVAGFLLVLLQAAWRLAADFAWLRGLMVLTVALSALRPRDGLLMIAGLSLPIGVLGAAWGTPYSARELLLFAAFTGWSIRVAAVRPSRSLLPADLSGPLICVVAVILASLAVEVWGQLQLIGAAEFRSQIERALRHGFLVDRRQIRGLNAAVAHLQGIAVFAAVVAASTGCRQFSSRVVALAVIGGAAAGLLNLLRVATVSIASSAPAARLRELLATVRVNVHFADINAAGSYFALMLFPAAGYAAETRGWQRAGWTLGSAVILAAAWLTKSRAALGAILLVGTGFLAIRLLRQERRSRRLWIGGACAIVTAAILITFPNRFAGAALTSALEIRLELARISMQMVARQPLFGVGVDGFYESSAPLLLASPIGKYYLRENAHNNYLQILAEFGIVGFAAIMWLVWRVAGRIRAPADWRSSLIARGVVAGLLAFGLTALAGHPLLTPEVNQAFWLMLGAAAGIYDQPAARRTTVAHRLPVATFVVLMIAILPIRFRSEVSTLNLEHVRYGVSRWRIDAGGTRYQTFSDRATLFVSSSVSSVRIPVREELPAAESRLQIYLEGRLVNEVRTGSEWQYVRMLAPPGDRGKHFLRIDLVPVPATDHERELQVGRLEPTLPPQPR